MAINAAQATTKTVGDPNASYESLRPLWQKCKAVCSGERFVKELDSIVNLNNLLIPFSPSMTQAQYELYKAEAELPGISAQFAKLLVGGLLRKVPTLTFSKEVPKEASDWILDSFGQDDSTIVSFMDTCLWEEVRTSRCWIYIDHPEVTDRENKSREDIKDLKPYPIVWQAESIINWRVTTSETGRTTLDRVIVRGFTEVYDQNEFHPNYIDTVWVHEINEAGRYQVRIFQHDASVQDIPTVVGAKQHHKNKLTFKLVETKADFEINGKPLGFIPAWPLNGSLEAVEPILITIVDKEISLYNKISRRNHLLYGAATYTPVIFSDMSDESFESIVSGGLGSWIKLGLEDKADILKTPTDALIDMDRAIASSIEEIAKLGVRMLTPETAQSGVALQLRNASQTAQLGTLNTKISAVMSQIIAFMLNWRYDLKLEDSDVDFQLSADFDPVPLGADWLRLCTEWYEKGLIPRSAWLNTLKQNDMLTPDYDDKEGQLEINNDEIIVMKGTADYANKFKEE